MLKAMSVPLMILLVWLVGVPAAFCLLVLTYPRYLRRRVSRRGRAARGRAGFANSRSVS
jgi:hypothetical protein